MAKFTRAQQIGSVARRVTKDRLRLSKSSAVNSGMPHASVGLITVNDHRGRGKVSGRIGVSANAGGVLGDPAVAIAYRIRSALTSPARSTVCTIYDAAGKAIATIDPNTRERKAL